MTGTFGFSYVGMVYLLMLFIPNGIWSKNQPTGYDDSNENKVLWLMERFGQICVTVCALTYSDFNIKPFSAWSLWLVVSFGLMIIYEMFWRRYFRGGHTLRDFYGSFLGVPLPGAVLPVAAFLLLGIYGKVIWMVLGVVLLGVGHIGIHAGHWKTYKSAEGR